MRIAYKFTVEGGRVRGWGGGAEGYWWFVEGAGEVVGM